MWTDEELGAVVEGQGQGAAVADLDGGDGLHEQVEDGSKAGSGSRVEFVPFAARVAEQERCLDDQFGVNAVALVRVPGDQGEAYLEVERSAPDLAAGQHGGCPHPTSSLVADRSHICRRGVPGRLAATARSCSVCE